MKRRLICLLLSLLCGLSLCDAVGTGALADDVFRYNDDIVWGASSDDVLSAESASADALEAVGGLEIFTVRRQTDETQKIASVSYFFRDKGLALICETVIPDTQDYGLREVNGEELYVVTDWHFDSTLAAMVERYGEPGPGDPERSGEALWRLGLNANREWAVKAYNARVERGMELMDWETEDSYIWFEQFKGECYIFYLAKAAEE